MIWKRRLWFTLLYFCEGAPIGLIWWAAPTLLRARGVDLETLTAITSVSILPWTLKVFWSPLVDILRNRIWSFPQWVAAMQIGMALALVPLFFFEWKDHPHLLVLCFAVHGIFAATQDVSIDAWAIQETPEWDRSRTAGLMEAGMLAGSWVFGGGTLFVSSWVDPKSMIVVMIALLISVALFAFLKRSFAPLSIAATETLAGRSVWILKRMREVLGSRISWVGLFAAVTSGAVLKAFGVLFGPYLTDKGWSEVEVGSAFSVTTGATLIGSLAGGFLADRLGRVRVAQAAIVLLVLSSAAFFQSESAAAVLILGAGVFFVAGFFLSAFFGMLMSLSDSRMSATQFSLFMAGVNLCESWSGWAAGNWANQFGYDKAFLILGGISLLAIPALGVITKWDKRPFVKS